MTHSIENSFFIDPLSTNTTIYRGSLTLIKKTLEKTTTAIAKTIKLSKITKETFKPSKKKFRLCTYLQKYIKRLSLKEHQNCISRIICVQSCFLSVLFWILCQLYRFLIIFLWLLLILTNQNHILGVLLYFKNSWASISRYLVRCLYLETPGWIFYRRVWNLVMKFFCAISDGPYIFFNFLYY